MAKIDFGGIELYAEQLAKLGARAEGICRYAVFDAAGMVIDAIKENAPVGTGDLRDSAILTPFVNEEGYVYTKVVFDGYDRNGTPNAVKAAVLESGTSRMKKRPFIRPAINRVKKEAEQSIADALDRKINEIMNE